MNIKAILAAAFATLLFSSTAYSQTINLTFVNCPTNRNGIDQSNEKSNGVPGHTIDTRRGNNGKGNGGESWDLYIVSPTERIVECIQTADENTSGNVYIKPPLPLPGGTGWIPVASTRELDPGMAGSYQF